MDEKLDDDKEPQRRFDEKSFEDGEKQHVEHVDVDLEKGIRVGGGGGGGGAGSDVDGIIIDDEANKNRIEAVLSGDCQTNELSFRPVDPVDVSVRNLSVSLYAGPSILSRFVPGNKGGAGG